MSDVEDFLKNLPPDVDVEDTRRLIEAYEALAAAGNEVITRLKIKPQVVARSLAIMLGRFVATGVDESGLASALQEMSDMMVKSAAAEVLGERIRASRGEQKKPSSSDKRLN